MADDIAQLNAEIEALTDQLAECDDAAQRRELREQSLDALAQLSQELGLGY